MMADSVDCEGNMKKCSCMAGLIVLIILTSGWRTTTAEPILQHAKWEMKTNGSDLLFTYDNIGDVFQETGRINKFSIFSIKTIFIVTDGNSFKMKKYNFDEKYTGRGKEDVLDLLSQVSKKPVDEDMRKAVNQLKI